MTSTEIDLHKLDPADRRFIRNIDWNLLKVFAEIVRNDGITNAAIAMSRQQPSVSSSLKRLEEFLGHVLCDRGPAGFTLTDHGERLYEICDKIELLVHSLQPEFDEIDNDISIQFTIVTVGNIVSPRLDETIQRFGQKYPRAELLIKVASCPEIETIILDGDADLGICPAPKMVDDLEYTYLFTEHHLPVCGRLHPLYGIDIQRRRELIGESFIFPGVDEADHIRKFRETHGWGNNTSGQSLDLNEVKRLVMAALGVALLPYEYAAADLETGALWPLMNPLPELSDDVFLVMHSKGHRRLAAQKFQDLLPEIEEL